MPVSVPSRLALPWLQLIMSTVASSMSFGFPGYRQQGFITCLANIYVLHVTCNLYFCILWFLNVRCWKINLLLLLLQHAVKRPRIMSISSHMAHVWIVPYAIKNHLSSYRWIVVLLNFKITFKIRFISIIINHALLSPDYFKNETIITEHILIFIRVITRYNKYRLDIYDLIQYAPAPPQLS